MNSPLGDDISLLLSKRRTIMVAPRRSHTPEKCKMSPDTHISTGPSVTFSPWTLNGVNRATAYRACIEWDIRDQII